jgi:hypothetical protein
MGVASISFIKPSARSRVSTPWPVSRLMSLAVAERTCSMSALAALAPPGALLADLAAANGGLAGAGACAQLSGVLANAAAPRWAATNVRVLGFMCFR